MRVERELVRRRGATSADRMVSSSHAMEEMAQLVPSSSFAPCPRGFIIPNTRCSARASFRRLTIRHAPIMLACLVLLLSVGLAASEQHDEAVDRPHQVVAQNFHRTNAFNQADDHEDEDDEPAINDLRDD